MGHTYVSTVNLCRWYVSYVARQDKKIIDYFF